MKSSVQQIRDRFDRDVERFSNLETGQSATMDAPLVMELIARAAAAATSRAQAILDVGCGAGNYSLKLLEVLPGCDVTLLDLSRPMLDRAAVRVGAATTGTIRVVQDDMRETDLGEANFDVIVATAVLHHLREDAEWAAVFAQFFRALRPGGSLWISDLVEHAVPGVRTLMWQRYGEYLAHLRDEAYRDTVLAYIEQEDTPRPLPWQLDQLRAAGFEAVEVLHKNSCFAAFGAVK